MFKRYGWFTVLVLLAVGPAYADEAGFGKSVDLDSFRLIALQNDGRCKTLDTLARETVRQITGSTFFIRQLAGATVQQDPVFTYLDMIFNSETYQNLRVIHIKKQPIRQALTAAAANKTDPVVLIAILKDGLVSLRFLQMPEVRAKLLELRTDIMRSAKEVDNLVGAAEMSSAQSLQDAMRVLPPPQSTSADDRWVSISTLVETGEAGKKAESIPGLEPAVQASLTKQWEEAGRAWRAGDAAGVNQALNALAAELPNIVPRLYPTHRKLALEHWYYKYNKMTWSWWFYLVAVVFLLMGIVYRWPRARAIGLGAFGFSFSLHTVACGIRWYLAGRIPNSNMFEAVTAAAWFGVAVAMFYEMGPKLAGHRGVWRAAWVGVVGGLIVFTAALKLQGVPFHEWQLWGPVPVVALITVAVSTMTLVSMASAKRFSTYGLPLLGSAVVAMAALMCGNFMTIRLDSDISNRMPVLNDVWLYIHTNMIIASYALIGIAYVTAAIYVIGRMLTHPTQSLWWSMFIPTAVIPLVGLIPGIGLMMIMPAWIPFLLIVVVVLVCYALRFVLGSGVSARSFAVWEGLPIGAGVVSTAGYSGGGAAFTSEKPAKAEGLGKVLDGATMLLLELFFITLWTGIIMGAVWADHSWGRPWGWDPKEVFALNTWIIFLIMVHVRIKVQDKALWTAVLAVVGCSVMLFNWIVVNFFITGLHSYA